MNFRTSSDAQVVRNFLKKARNDALVIGNQINKVQALAGVPVEDRYYVPAEDTSTGLGFMEDLQKHPILLAASALLIVAWFKK